MIPFSPPRIDEKIIDEVTSTLRSKWISTGPKTKLFERRLEEFTRAKRVFCCSANTTGMELFLRWLGIGPGDEVIVPAYTYCATANVVVHLGATPVMVDVREDFTIDPEKVDDAITADTKAVIAVDLGGLPADYSRLWQVIESHNRSFSPNSDTQRDLGRIALLTDAAHSLGAKYENENIGTQADAMVFSFHAVKNLTTAEGGGIALNLPEHFDHDLVYNWLNTRSLHGQSKDALAKTKVGGWEYDVVEAGWKCNMTDLQAAIGLVELERYASETLPKRKAICESYTKKFADYEWAELPVQKDRQRVSSYHLYPIRIKGVSLMQRNKIIDAIFQKEVSVNVHYKPLPLLSVYRNMGYKMEDYPMTKALWESEISLPVYFDLTEDQINQVVEAVVSSVKEVL